MTHQEILACLKAAQAARDRREIRRLCRVLARDEGIDEREHPRVPSEMTGRKSRPPTSPPLRPNHSENSWP